MFVKISSTVFFFLKSQITNHFLKNYVMLTIFSSQFCLRDCNLITNFLPLPLSKLSHIPHPPFFTCVTYCLINFIACMCVCFCLHMCVCHRYTKEHTQNRETQMKRIYSTRPLWTSLCRLSITCFKSKKKAEVKDNNKSW